MSAVLVWTNPWQTSGLYSLNRMSCWLLHVFPIPHVKTSQQTFDTILLWIVWSTGIVDSGPRFWPKNTQNCTKFCVCVFLAEILVQRPAFPSLRSSPRVQRFQNVIFVGGVSTPNIFIAWMYSCSYILYVSLQGTVKFNFITCMNTKLAVCCTALICRIVERQLYYMKTKNELFISCWA